jgi:hypothetical protein
MSMLLKAHSRSLMKTGIGVVFLATLTSCNKNIFEGMSPKKEANSEKSRNDRPTNDTQFLDHSKHPTDDTLQSSTNKAAIGRESLKIKGFLTAKDFSIPKNLQATTNEDLTSKIPATGAFFPSSCLIKDGQECAEIAMDQNLDDALVSVEGGVATVNFDIDASVCNGNYGPVSLEWKPGTGVLKMGCLTDLSAYDGRTWASVKTGLISDCEESGEGSVLYNAQLVGVLDLRSTGSTIPTQDLTINVARMSPDSEGCSITLEDGNIAHGPCRNIVQVSRDTPGSSTYSEVAIDQARSPRGVNMFTSGSANFIINGWTGTMSYGANGEQAAWQAIDPAKNLKAQGTLDPTY